VCQDAPLPLHEPAALRTGRFHADERDALRRDHETDFTARATDHQSTRIGRGAAARRGVLRAGLNSNNIAPVRRRRWPTDIGVLQVFDDSLRRCSSDARFYDRFYERFLASSPKVREKFSRTDFVRQRRALSASLHLILLVAHEPAKYTARYLDEVAERHSSRDLDIGAELYDLWLDCLLATVREFDPQFSPAVEQAWEDAMGIGIRYLCSRY
jgi:hemoglobin-like flavoprotein